MLGSGAKDITGDGRKSQPWAVGEKRCPRWPAVGRRGSCGGDCGPTKASCVRDELTPPPRPCLPAHGSPRLGPLRPAAFSAVEGGESPPGSRTLGGPWPGQEDGPGLPIPPPPAPALPPVPASLLAEPLHGAPSWAQPRGRVHRRDRTDARPACPHGRRCPGLRGGHFLDRRGRV